jgi:lipopolysaccharide biosynthesis glycosyltransferase
MSGPQWTMLHVACAADARYLPYCATMLQSLFAHVPKQRIVVHYLCPPDFDRACRCALMHLVNRWGNEIVFHAIPDNRVDGLPPMRNVRRTIWYRLFLPELLPNVDRLLYLDADVLVVDRIDSLWHADLGGQPLGAVANAIEPGTRARLLPAIGLPTDAKYFNSGVMLMDLRALREGGWAARVLDFAHEQGSKLVWGDQDALNGILCAHYQPLHPRWNCMNALFYFHYARDVYDERTISEACGHPAILHFEGPDDVKPWDARSTHPWRQRYLRELRSVLWLMPWSLWARLARYIWYTQPWWLRRALASLRRGAARRRALRPA